MSVAVVMPARFGSTRFPGKPLAEISGRTLIEWVYRRAQDIDSVDYLVVATDDDRIADVVRGFGGNVTVTDAHDTGTDRVAAVAESLDADIVVNLQGDEPVFDPGTVSRMVHMLLTDADIAIATAAHRIESRDVFENPNVVKVVFNDSGRALYFSRSPIPSGAFTDHGGAAWRHVGIYAYRRDALVRFAALEQTEAEKSERLEQLRALESGMQIGVVTTEVETFGVDVPDDLKNVEKALSKIYTD